MVIFAFNLRFCMEVYIIKIGLKLQFWILNDHSFSLMYETKLIVFFVLLTSYFAYKYNLSNFLQVIVIFKKIMLFHFWKFYFIWSLFTFLYLFIWPITRVFTFFRLLFILLFGRNGVYCPILKIQVSKLV